MNKQIAQDGTLILWDSTRCNRSVVEEAFAEVEMERCIPTADFYDAAKETARVVVQECDLHQPSSTIKYEALGGGKCSLEVVRKIKGVKKNAWPHLFSISLVERQPKSVLQIVSVDPSAGPVFDRKDEMEEIINDVFTECLATMSAKDLTEALVRLVKSCKGVSLKNNGGTYFMPKGHAAAYEHIAQRLAPHGPNLVSATMDLNVNPALVKQVMRSVEEQIAQTLNRLREKHASVVSRGGKTRSNGMKTRSDEVAACLSMLRSYRKYLGVPFKKTRRAIEDATVELGLEAMRSGLV